MLKIIFTCVKIVAHPRLMLHCGIILGTYNLDFRHENNSTPGVLIEEIRYLYVCMCMIVLVYSSPIVCDIKL